MDTPLLFDDIYKSMTYKSPIPAWFRYPRFNWNKKHAIVIGGGVAGCQTAWHLIQQGWRVTLIEREAKLAQQASGNPAGIISPKMTAKVSQGEDFYVNCFNYVVKQLRYLKQTHSTLDWHDCGLLQLAHNQRELQRWESLKSRQLTSREFDSEFLQLLDQNQSSEIAGIPLDYKASYFPQAGWINPVSLCETLIADCGDKCDVILETDVIKLKYHQDSWRIQNQQNRVIADDEVVIIASGKDLNQFSQTQQLPAMPVAGQTTVATTNAYARGLKTTLGHQGYLTPCSTKTNQITFGASFDKNKNKAKLNPKTDLNNVEQLRKYLPELADSFTQINSAHAAVRMTTPDRFPYVGGIANTAFYQQHYHDLHQGKQFKQYPDAEYLKGLFVLGGLGSRGLTSSGLCAKILCNILENNAATEYLNIQENCHPARYIIKELKRSRKRY